MNALEKNERKAEVRKMAREASDRIWDQIHGQVRTNIEAAARDFPDKRNIPFLR